MRRFWFLVVFLAVAAVLFWAARRPAAVNGPAGSAMATRPSVRGSSHAAQVAPVQTVASEKPASSRPPARPILVQVEPSDAAAIDAALPAPARTVGHVRIDAAAIEGKDSPFWQPAGSGRVELPLPSGRRLIVVIDDSEMLGARRWTSVGHVEGQPESRAIFAYHAGFLTASIDTADASFALRPATDTIAQLYEIDPARLPPCGGLRHPPVGASAATEPARRAGDVAAASVTGAPLTAAAENPQHAEVHVLMAYTTAVKANVPGLSAAGRVAALQSEFDAAIAKVNSELAASLVTARVKLVRIAETTYVSDGASGLAPAGFQDDALTALYKTNDGQMDELHALRDQCGADVVCLALNRADLASIGLSFVLGRPAAGATGTGATNPLYAFSVVQYSTVAGTDVVPHELGHLFGCAHARGDPGTTGSGDGAYPYSYGYRFTGRDGRQYHDIMAYQPGIALSYYSNPDLSPSPANAPIGIAPGLPGEADCALTIEQNAFELSTYRLQQTQAFAAGALINVATRAYVGTGDQVLIGGFVINGSQPKQVLVRAAGPALSGFGVSDALANPLLRVFSGSRMIAENDDWGVPLMANAGDPAEAAARVGAFAFTRGSADAALVLTLAPGAYSAVMEGAGGTAGSGLVEVYDVDRGSNSIINLATRGYADRPKPMFAGFVAQGAPGTTKRVLIRVLGPTLNRSFGIAGAMDDPMMDLHDASGALLMKNDDWSSGAEGGASAANDFSPLIRYYSEQQISATGLAPPNRREPCLMVDLAPGSYSVVAQPFEDLARSPPQPAQAGVGIVEVYEIAP